MYEKFVAEAVEKYRELPYETNELYKKYKLKINPPLTFNKKLDNSKDWEELLEEATKSLNIKFDVVIHNGIIVQNQCGDIAVNQENYSELNNEFWENKLFDNSEDKFAAYIHAYSDSIIEINASAYTKINILFITSSNPPPIQINLKNTKNSNTIINEFYISKPEEECTVGFMHEIHSEINSQIELSMLHMEASNTDVFTLVKGDAKENSLIKTNMIFAGSRNTRHRNEIKASGKNSEIEMNDSVIGIDSSKIDIGNKTINSKEMTKSDSNIRAIMFDNSTAYIKGFAKIESGSTKSVSKINERGILDGKNAFLYLIPDMSIDENDVIAKHSSASAPIDKDKIFYLQSHGIDFDTSRYLIMNGLLSEVISKVNDSQMQIILYSVLADRIKNKKFTIPKVSGIQQEVWSTTIIR